MPAQRVQRNPIANKLNIAMYERVNYAWVPESDVLKALDLKNTQVNPLYLPRQSRSDSYLHHWLVTMKAAYAQNACPWLKRR